MGDYKHLEHRYKDQPMKPASNIFKKIVVKADDGDIQIVSEEGKGTDLATVLAVDEPGG